MRLVGRFIKHLLLAAVFCAVGLGLGLVILRYRQEGRLLNPFDASEREWAKGELERVSGTVKRHLLNSRAALDEWFRKHKHSVPDTQELLRRAIAYLEAEPAAPAGAASATPPAAPVPAAQKAAAPPPQPATAEPFAEEMRAIPPQPSEITAPTPPAREPLQTCPLDDPHCQPATDTAVAVSVGTAAANAPAAPAGPAATAEERARALAAAGEHIRKGRRHYLAALPGREDATTELAGARAEFEAADKVLSGYLATYPADAQAQAMLAEVRRNSEGLPVLAGPLSQPVAAAQPVATETTGSAATATAAPAASSAAASSTADVSSALDTAVGGAQGGMTHRLASQQEHLRKAREHYRKALEQYRLSMPGQPDNLSHLKEATREFEATQSLLYEHVEKYPDDPEMQKFFLDVNCFLYDCYKRTPVIE